MTARVLFDTSVIIDPRDVQLGDLSGARPVVSAVTIAELAYGLDVDDPVERHIRLERLESLLSRTEILPFDTKAARLYGTLAALVRRSGRDPRPRRMDLQIAATAGAHSLPVLTRNGRDFAGLERVVRVIET
ncbi:type II toxin-antitoxin system VapC family toxin [Amycolatopsis taiwanensis]|uniref:type II toxin-antitoxin system VapC family toxin n=1 Tax=Amycolatopsis taiwanensis TaxID=342230 RepID=UPI00047F0741|nr:type II toxin-antitoxin system VapC family toxin [Amycolatopsis taiwanensis]